MEYRYQPLPPLPELGRSPPFSRVLRLAPGLHRDEPLHAVLEPVDVSATTPYEALSYTWGTDPPSDYLWLGDCPLPIKPNLEAALRALRLPGHVRRLWVDAVCIDQSNVDERTRQVHYMRLVYKHSTRVIVWLGVRTPGVEHAFAAASRLSQAMEVLREAGGESGYSGVDPQAAEAFVDSAAGDLPRTSLHHLSELFDRPYWTRTWCIQEVVAAPWATVKVEDLEIPFLDLMSTFTLVAEWRREVELDKPFAFWSLISAERLPHRPLPPSAVPGSMGSLLSVLEHARGFQATDIRDKVFAMFGICDEVLRPALAWTQTGNSNPGLAIRALRRVITKVNDFGQRHSADPDFGVPLALRPDYRKPAADVYVDVTRFLMSKPPRMLDVLGHLQHNADPSPSDEYPSWVPKWFEPSSCFAMRGAFLAGLCDGHFKSFAELHDTPLRGRPIRPRVLSLDGFRVDVVDKVSDVLEFGFDDNERTVAAVGRAWAQLFPFPMFGAETPPYQSGESLGVAFCSALGASSLGFIMGSVIRNFTQGRLSVLPPEASMGDRGIGPLSERCEREIANFLAYLRQRQLGSDGTTRGEAPAIFAPAEDADTFIHYIAGVRMFSLNRRVFVTRAGRVGIGPKVTRPGDEVAVLLGGRLPFILRPQPDHHQLLGATYVHDHALMWGDETEKVRFNKPGAAARVTFELR